MSTSNTHQQSLADAGSETRPPMLERGSYILWASRFRRYLNRKRENRKWLNKAIDEGPYEFRTFTPSETEAPRMQKEEDLRGDDLKHYEAEIEAMNLILISIPNDIYKSVDACTTAKAMWQRVERLMRRTVQNKVDRETRFNNEFDQFVAKPGEALVSVYNRFAQLMNDFERNGIKFPPITVNTKFLNCLQHEWLKYVTQVLLAKRLTEDSYDDFFDYLQQFERTVTHIGDRVNIQSRNYGNDGRKTIRSYVQEEVIEGNNVPVMSWKPYRESLRTSFRTTTIVQRYNCSEKGHYARNCSKPRVQDSKYFMEQMLLAKHDEAGVIITDEYNDFLFADASRMEEIKDLSANICLMARIQLANIASDAEPSYDSAFLSEYPKQPKIINNIFGDDQIDKNIIFDEPNDDVNSSSVEDDNNAQQSYELEQLARNAYKEADKQQIIAKTVQQQNTVLTKQLELYKEKVRVFEITKGNNTTYFNEYIEADQKAKRFEHITIIIIHARYGYSAIKKQQRDKLELSVVELKRQTVEFQKTQSILKRKMSENEDKYHDTVLDLEAKAKKNVDVMLKIGNSLQGMFMLGPKPVSYYDSQLKHGLGYANPYTLKKAISHNPKLYDASCLDD
ncbi:hypothetical protein Tco_0458248 [Tanacetum coccineum]